MKKIACLVPVFFLIIGAVFPQGRIDGIDTSVPNTNVNENADVAPSTVVNVNPVSADSPIYLLDAAVRATAEELGRILVELKALRVAVGQFTYNQNIPPLSSYWVSQLTEELVNMPDRPFSVLSTGVSGAEWTISGEIVEVANVVRVYTRLVNNSDRTIEAAVHSDLERTDYIINMLYYETSSSSSSSDTIRRDAWEPDSWDNPVSYEIGNNENVA
ncbi:MAG: hypothetical protein LBI14_06785, partial [Treponema sp.]|nr:hypothetical protein [Treponema sp.]